jgi:soluble lytic murein transglycosylase-like protein
LLQQARLVALVALLCSPAFASGQVSNTQPNTWTTCFDSASAFYGIGTDLLLAIAHVESGLDPRALNRNTDGSSDLGLMQINTRWLPLLQRTGIAPESLYDPCTSIWIGAWVLAGNFARYGYVWSAVGAYNAGTVDTPAAERRRLAYARKVAAALARMQGGSSESEAAHPSNHNAHAAMPATVVQTRTTGSRVSRADSLESVQ